MNWNIAFAPELPLWIIALILLPSLALVLWGLFSRVRGSWIRTFAWAALALALANPSLLIEDREKLKSVIAVVVDQTGSQKLENRETQTLAARDAVLSRIGGMDEFEVREISASDQVSTTTDVSTALFRALQSGLKDVAADRLAGAVMITDGRVHDLPESLSSIGVSAPVHALLTGRENEKDRRIVITKAPRYGVVGEPYEIGYRVLEEGFPPGETVAVSIYIDGELVTAEEVLPGDTGIYADEVRHGGKNIIELRVETHPDEITDANNRVFTTLNGIRENLRVLLVSGEPHAGERTWRNLLKSDASVDLVHFTILRPPEKQDGTPISQLSLIAFPTRELFVEKIDEFDLIIFDRYSRRGVLPVLYFDNIARYVRDGGAVLVASGSEYASEGSIAGTPLQDVLSAMPSGTSSEVPFKPRISGIGMRHPVTRGLEGSPASPDEEPQWGRWFRSIDVQSATGEVVMETPDKKPLLALERFDKGRMALLLSDQAWLWARGFEGGGPHVQLLRRIAHWLMAEPELEEERLTADSAGGTINITRQTLGDDPGEVVVRGPTGTGSTVQLTRASDGIFTGRLEVDEIGLYQLSNGDLSALVQVGPPNPREFAEVTSTGELLRPVVEANGGSVARVGESGTDVPRILPVRPGSSASGNGWIGFNNTGASVLKGVDRISLFAGFLGLALLLFAFAAAWTREGR
jgi:hypothetical protein